MLALLRERLCFFCLLLCQITFFPLSVTATCTTSLEKVLEKIGANCWLEFIREEPALGLPPDSVGLIALAPTNDAMKDYYQMLGVSGCGYVAPYKVTARDREELIKRAPNSRGSKKLSVLQKSQTYSAKMLTKRDLKFGGSLYETLLNDPDLVHLGPGVHASVVGQPSSESMRKDLSSISFGMGESTEILPGEYPFDEGVVRLATKVPTPPENVSGSVQALGQKFFELLRKAGLLDKVNKMEGVTVLMPNDKAIGGCWDRINTLPKKKLRRLLLRHILTRVAYSPTLEEGCSIKTASGDSVKVTYCKGSWYFDKGRVGTGDVLSINGVIHEVDQVLWP